VLEVEGNRIERIGVTFVEHRPASRQLDNLVDEDELE
jgi:hypothetical protein